MVYLLAMLSLVAVINLILVNTEITLGEGQGGRGTA